MKNVDALGSTCNMSVVNATLSSSRYGLISMSAWLLTVLCGSTYTMEQSPDPSRVERNAQGIENNSSRASARTEGAQQEKDEFLLARRIKHSREEEARRWPDWHVRKMVGIENPDILFRALFGYDTDPVCDAPRHVGLRDALFGHSTMPSDTEKQTKQDENVDACPTEMTQNSQQTELRGCYTRFQSKLRGREHWELGAESSPSCTQQK